MQNELVNEMDNIVGMLIPEKKWSVRIVAMKKCLKVLILEVLLIMDAFQHY